MHDLAIILVSHHGARWLPASLDSIFRHTGSISVDVVVASNSEDGTYELVTSDYPAVRVVRCENRGFAHANNQASLTCDARYFLFLNVDTEVLSGTFGDLVAAMDARPAVGLAGVRQVGPDGVVAPSIRRFPNALRAFCDAIGFEHLPIRTTWSGERDLRPEVYDQERPIDWTSGSFLIVRRDVLRGVGLMDERFFLYCEEPDLCLRAKQAGWEVHHLPAMTILHHAGKAGANPRLTSQDAYARLQFARKHFTWFQRTSYAAALGLGYALRSVAPGGARATRRVAARHALRTLVGIDGPPFGPPPGQSFGTSSGPQ